MEEHGNHIVAEQLNYSRSNASLPKYKFSRVVPLSGSQVVSLPVSSTAEVLFEIPTNVVNLSESYLYGTVSYARQGANNFTWLFTDGMPLISEVDLYTRSGIYLCQLPNFQNYMKIVRKLYTKKQEHDVGDLSTFLLPSNALANAAGQTPNNGPASVNYMETLYLLNNSNFGQAADSQIDITMNFPLSAIKKTIFDLNLDLVWPDILVLRILFGPANKAAYQGTSAVNPATGATDIATGVLTGLASGTQAIQINSLTLYLATEKNEDLAQTCRSLVNSLQGMNILIPYPYTYKQNLSGTSHNTSIRINRGHGKNLLCIVTTPFNNTEKNQTAYDCFNVTNASTAAETAVGSKITNYYTQLDNIRLQDITLVCGNQLADDYRENRKFFKESPYLNQIVYNNNWLHMDKFYEDDCDYYHSPHVDMGLSLIVERKWDFLAVVPNVQLNWYSHVIVQKYLHIGSQMIQYM